VPLRVISMPITCQVVVPPDGISPSAGDYTIHTYPFDGLPLLRSHLHPKFAIVEAGRRLEGLEPNIFKQLLVDFPSLSLIGNLYEAWLRVPPAGWKEDISFNVLYVKDDDDDDDDDDSDPNYDDQTSIGWPLFGTKCPAQSSLTCKTKRKRPNPQPWKYASRARNVTSVTVIFPLTSKGGSSVSLSVAKCEISVKSKFHI
jgi:hypothetical protein